MFLIPLSHHLKSAISKQLPRYLTHGLRKITTNLNKQGRAGKIGLFWKWKKVNNWYNKILQINVLPIYAILE